MIIDVFLFDNEFDMLECRMYELRGVVDLHVAIEADHTFTGTPKPYHLTENLSRFPDAPLEVLTVETGDPPDIAPWGKPYIFPETRPFWSRDAVQRNAAMRLLASQRGNTVVIHGDVDEIPRRWALSGFDGKPQVLVMDMLIYSTGLVHPDTWAGPVIGRLSDLPPMADIRNNRWSFLPGFAHAGWHLSWFGTPEDRARKMAAFSHQELASKVGDRVASEFPAAHLHVDGETLLEPYAGDLPDWVKDGLAPEHWTRSW